jgi:hypothetical protein
MLAPGPIGRFEFLDANAMTIKFTAHILLVGAWLGLTCLHPAQAQAPTEYYWYDGGVRRALFIDGSQVADFAAAREGKSVLKAAGLIEKSAVQSSPVFKDAAGEGARQRALPGGVILVLQQAMAEADARKMLTDLGLNPVRMLGEQRDTWLIESAPGLATLRLANQLHESGRYKSAAPNWWVPRTRK